MGKVILGRAALLTTTAVGLGLCLAVHLVERQPWRAVLLGTACLVTAGLGWIVGLIVREGDKWMDQVERDNERMVRWVLTANQRRAKALITRELKRAAAKPAVYGPVEERCRSLLRAGRAAPAHWRFFMIGSWEQRALLVTGELGRVSGSELADLMEELGELEAGVTLLAVCPAEWVGLVDAVAKKLGIELAEQTHEAPDQLPNQAR